ncbi:MAG: HesA/MoeB/ThiF family protein [Candidatus Caldatribacteriota bacterium]|nr:HesA/MoeB/ThiF family protein [Candidatus Caldatribacteriota bacterium]
MKENMKNEKEKIILKELEKIKEEAINSSGKKYYSISVKQIKEIACKFQTKSRELDILALQNNIMPKRYKRNLGVLSPSEQTKLLQSRVAIIGAGGLGGTVLELLTRMGIGELIIVDKDTIGDSNLNRQILSNENNLEQSKTEVAVKRVKEINSSIDITGHSVFINSDNVKKIIKGAGVVVDALDNLPSRFVLQRACQDLKIPLVHGAIAGFNGQLTTIFPQDKGLELIYGSDRDLPKHGSEVTLGAPTVTPAIIASLEAQEVIKILLKRGKLFRNKLLYLDIENGTIEILKLVVSE